MLDDKYTYKSNNNYCIRFDENANPDWITFYEDGAIIASEPFDIKYHAEAFEELGGNVKRELVRAQIELFNQIQIKGFNIVTCNVCDAILIHKVGEESVKCFSCLANLNLNYCTDYWVTGEENSEQFNN